MSITVSSKNQIVIPKGVRKKMGINSGDLLVVSNVTKNTVTLKKAPSAYDMIGLADAKKDDVVARVRKNRQNWR